MVKAADLGYKSKNLEQIPTQEDKREQARLRALSNLTQPELPNRITPVDLPKSLLSLTGE